MVIWSCGLLYNCPQYFSFILWIEIQTRSKGVSCLSCNLFYCFMLIACSLNHGRHNVQDCCCVNFIKFYRFTYIFAVSRRCSRRGKSVLLFVLSPWFNSLNSKVVCMFVFSHFVLIYQLSIYLFYSIKKLEDRSCAIDNFVTIPFRLVHFSVVLVQLGKSIPVPSLLLSSHLFFCIRVPIILFSFHCACRIVFVRQEDIETWPNHLSLRFQIRVRSLSYSPMAF